MIAIGQLLDKRILFLCDCERVIIAVKNSMTECPVCHKKWKVNPKKIKYFSLDSGESI